MGHNRRRSNSSSSSSSSSSSDEEKKKWKKEKKDKKNKHGEAHGGYGFPSASHAIPAGFAHSAQAGHGMMMPGVAHMPAPPISGGRPISRGPSPAPGMAQQHPASGFRIPLSNTTAFPTAQAGPPVAYDADGHTPVYVGSAIWERAVHPCKIVPTFDPPPRVAYGGGEHEHRGRYDLLPFDAQTMEWVPASNGQLPQGRRLVEGGFEEGGDKLYHALATIHGVRVPGKTGTHLRGANIPFGGQEHVVEHYDILCWRF